MGHTDRTERLLMAALRPLTGDRGTATALVKSTVAEGVKVPCNCYALPIPESDAGNASIDDHRIIRTAEDVIATPDGAEVAVTSLLGGERHNALKAGTQLYWDPPMVGLETHSRLITDMTGATDPPRFPNGDYMPWFVKEITTFENLAPAGGITEQTKQLFQTRLMQALPAVVITWRRTGPHEILGNRKGHRPDIWWIYAISQRRSGESQRRHEAGRVLDMVELLLTDRGFVDGEAFSAPPAKVEQRIPGAMNVAFTSRVLQLATYRTVKGLDLRVDEVDGMTPEDLLAALWERTSYRLHTTDEPPKDVVRNVVDPMPLGAFSDEFSDEFD